MDKIFGRILMVFAGMLFQAAAFAQNNDTDQVQMADSMRSEGKIYVVVAVLSVVLLGIFLYLVRLDRKISKLEKQTK